jgi:structural maintenance of chromosome 4
VKRARPSFENKAEGLVKSEPEEDADEIPKPKRGKRGASVIKSTPAPEMDVDEEPPSKPTSRRTSSRTTAVSSGSRASVGSSKASLSAQIEEEEAEGSQEEDVKPTTGRRAPAKSGKKASRKVVQSSDEDGMSVASEEYQDEDEKLARKGRKGKTPAARKGKAPAKQASKAKVIEESNDEMEAPPSAQPRPNSSQAVDIDSAPSEMPAAVEEVEEERSLFDPPPLPAPSSQLNTMPEEPAGPKSRLVIHKMALINFKSYAGRQEIGPFHKVNIPIFNAPLWPRSYVKLFSRFLLLSAPTDPVNRTRLTPFYLSLDIGLLKCDKANSLSSSIIRPTIQTWMSAVLRCIFVIS